MLNHSSDYPHTGGCSARLLLTFVCVLVSALVLVPTENVAAADLGVPDSVTARWKYLPTAGQADSVLSLEVLLYNDSQYVSEARVGLVWDNPLLYLDSAIVSGEAAMAFDSVMAVYPANDLDSANLYHHLAFLGIRDTLSGSGFPPLPDSARPVVTYFWHLVDWPATDSVCLDTAAVGMAVVLEFRTDDSSYVPIWLAPPCPEIAYGGPTWYVDAAGDDITGDGSTDNPFATL
ncbi:MAG: hypothetical protein KKA42_01090, partial [candidate division Zixibacteria bacterium]|nr:hypothetical protein [candidate division Zixibacteria bacterium]